MRQGLLAIDAPLVDRSGTERVRGDGRSVEKSRVAQPLVSNDESITGRITYWTVI